MSWDRRLDLHIDVDAPSSRNLLTSETDSSVLNAPPEFVSGDKLKVRLYFWRRGSVPGSLESIDPGASSTFRLSGRPQGVPAGSELLFLAATFTQVGTGIWETTLDLATAELVAHLDSAPAGAKTITAEIEVRDTADTTRRSIQFLARALPQVWDNQQSSPTAAPEIIGNTAPVNAAVWTARDSIRQWAGVASSADGTKIAATERNGQIYTSTDSGVTWTARNSNRNWREIRSSSDGSKLVAIVETGGQIYTSTDSGVTWTARDSGRFWRGLASSSDGSKLVAGTSNGNIYTSTDSGVTWTPRDSVRAWYSVASSADGSKLAATVFNGQIYTSTDSGVTWTARETNRNWYQIASSSDGSKLVAIANNGQIYTSTDSGVTWTARESNREWQTVHCSSDMQTILASAGGIQQTVFLSVDSGITWQQVTAAPLANYRNFASSSDFSKLMAAALSSNLYTVDASNLVGITPAPPHIRVAGGFLYIQEAGVWKKAALSDL